MAGYGKLALYCPVVIMTLVPSTLINFFTILSATTVFGFLLAIGAAHSTGNDILTSTAAYAGVLVVFAGSAVSVTPAAPSPN
jgi:hypothetical protein